ncbi:coiled-coil domain-containing protein 34-like [Anopheles funestus]|uniref:coiled-coil domain-containing protein 34-like n=1 Tax=Anopheles funestus TaxID=62324 RepID=UPI0020C661F0|nr:coiled-coil domain-containing protein 34-like [Anopheles funestus]
MDVAEASLELHSSQGAKMDTKRKENKVMKAIRVSTDYDSQESDLDEEENSDRAESNNSEHEATLCNAFSQMSLVNVEPSSNEESGSNAHLDINREKNIDNDCNLQQSDSEDDKQLNSKSDGYDTSGSSSVTLDLSSEDEDERQNFSTDRGDGDAGLNLRTDLKHQIIRVNVTPKKRERDPEAYKKWLKSKNEEIRKNREKELLARQELQRQKELEEERRKEINKKKIQEWIAGKKQSSKKSNAKPIDCKYVDSSSEHLNCDADAKYKSWLLKVKKQEEEKKLRDLTVKQLEQEILQEKKKMSEEIYQQWLKTAKHKPKPVPLNQGPHTLRGTVSKIFVNPEPWKGNCD